MALAPWLQAMAGDSERRSNSTDGITVVRREAGARRSPTRQYQSATPPQVTAKHHAYTVAVPFVGTWTDDVTEKATMPCG